MRKYYLVLIFFVFYGCSSKYKLGEEGDADIRIQAMKRKAEVGDQIYNIRLFPKKEILEANKNISRSMTYDVDSSFYLVKNHEKIFPYSVERIANGVPDSFEYLIHFDQNGISDIETLPLVYQDKYINQKIYQLLLK